MSVGLSIRFSKHNGGPLQRGRIKPGKSQPKTRSSLSSWRERSKAVRDYVLARAQGQCEACKQPAPFSKKDGSAYLEAHQIDRLADAGPDRPDSVTAICPNCHRRIHNGADGKSWNDTVRKMVLEKEIAFKRDC